MLLDCRDGWSTFLPKSTASHSYKSSMYMAMQMDCCVFLPEVPKLTMLPIYLALKFTHCQLWWRTCRRLLTQTESSAKCTIMPKIGGQTYTDCHCLKGSQTDVFALRLYCENCYCVIQMASFISKIILFTNTFCKCEICCEIYIYIYMYIYIQCNPMILAQSIGLGT